MDADKTKIILVGNSVFPKWGDEVKDIPNVEQNLDQLKKIFLDSEYLGIPNDSKHLIEIKDENSQDVLLKVKHETKACPEKDRFEKLIFYYSGHGIPGEDRKLFLASRDTVRGDYELTSVDSSRLFSYLKGFGAKQLIVILDCCYAAQTKENQGDADSLIEKCLPNQREEVDVNEIGAYYLFAAGKDNVAKFNPKEPKRPTYFTEALLFSVEGGTDSESEIITMGELYEYLCKQINRLKNENPDIPDPRPVLEGNVSGFHFCKNKRFESREDKDWVQLAKNPSVTELQNFQSKYPSTRYGSAINNLWRRLIAGYDALEEARATNDKVAVLKIKEEYTDIPIIFKQAIDLLNTMSSKYIEMEKNSRMAKPKEILQEASTMVSDSAKEFSSSTTQPEISEASPNLSQADINIKEGSMDKQKPAEMNSIRMESNQMASNSAAR